jgi:hypothetical protein
MNDKNLSRLKLREVLVLYAGKLHVRFDEEGLGSPVLFIAATKKSAPVNID